MPLARIFVSSVQGEMAAERRAVRDFVEGDALLSRFFAVFLFEDLPAADRRADATYLAEVDRCGLYVGLFGSDYGSEDAAGVSATEHEFDRATATGKTRLVYLKRTADRHPKMAALVRQAESQVVRRAFGSVSELTAALYASLVDWLEQTGRLRVKPFVTAACPEATWADLAANKLELFLSRAQSQRAYAHPRARR